MDKDILPHQNYHRIDLLCGFKWNLDWLKEKEKALKVDTDNLEYEILGHIMLRGSGAEHFENWYIDESSFTSRFTKSIYLAIKELHDKVLPIDPVMVMHQLAMNDTKYNDGRSIDAKSIYSLANEASGTPHIETYIKSLFEARNQEANNE